MNKILNHRYGSEILIGVLTIIKIIVVFIFFQNLVIFIDGVPHIASGYAWSELVSNMQNGEYFNTSQYTLSEMYDLKFHALRPPLYATFLFLLLYFGSFAGFVGVFIQSIVTSLISLISYKLIRNEGKNHKVALLGSIFIFFLPFNFLKSGSLDDATFMLLFILAGIYYLLKALRKSNLNWNYVVAGISFGLALLTRSAAMFAVFGIFIFVVYRYRSNFKGILMMILFIGILMSPWIIRNNHVIGKPVYTNGTGRVFLLMQTNEFINEFPYKSIDVIDRKYFKDNFEEYSYINDFLEQDKDNEFVRLAINNVWNNHSMIFKSLLTKLRAFVPFDYYPVRGDIKKTILYLLSYWSVIILFFTGLTVREKRKSSISLLFILVIICYSSIGIIGFMLSRHFYPLLVFMIISSGISFSNNKLGILSDRF